MGRSEIAHFLATTAPDIDDPNRTRKHCEAILAEGTGCTRNCGQCWLGIILTIVGALVSIPILLSVGIALALIGVVLEIAGSTGHALTGRRHHY